MVKLDCINKERGEAPFFCHGLPYFWVSEAEQYLFTLVEGDFLMNGIH